MATKMANSQSCQVTENRNTNKNRNTKKTQNTTTDLMQVVAFLVVSSKKKLVMVEKRFHSLIIHSMTLHNTLTAQSAEDVQCTPEFFFATSLFVHALVNSMRFIATFKKDKRK